MRRCISTTLAVALMLAAPGFASAGAYEDLLAAAENGENATVFDLIRRGMDINTSDAQGNTLVMIAARTGNLVLLDSLLKNRVNVNRRNRYGDTAVMLAALQGHVEAVHRLTDHGALLDGEGWSPLHYAVFRGSSELVRYLLDKGASVDAVAPNRQTALMIAVIQSGLPSLVQILLEAGANPELSDPDGLTARDHARKLGRTEALAILESRAR